MRRRFDCFEAGGERGEAEGEERKCDGGGEEGDRLRVEGPVEENGGDKIFPEEPIFERRGVSDCGGRPPRKREDATEGEEGMEEKEEEELERFPNCEGKWRGDLSGLR